MDEKPNRAVAGLLIMIMLGFMAGPVTVAVLLKWFSGTLAFLADLALITKLRARLGEEPKVA